MKRFIAVWLVAMLCAALMGGAPVALAEDQDDIILEMEQDEPELSGVDEIKDDGLDLNMDLGLDLEVLELPEQEAPEAVDAAQSNASEPDYTASNKIILKKLIRYEISDGEATVVSADKAITDAVIPETVSGYEVTSIADGAFSGCKKLWTVTVPETVTSIGEDAFSGCKALVNVELPESLVEIGAYAFKDCTMISHIVLPEGLTVIREGLFENCQILWKISIPSTVEVIEDGAFYKCLMLKNFKLPNGLMSMGRSAFELCEELRNLSIPASLAEIPERASYGCNDLKQLTLHSGLISIGDKAFYGCDSLRTLKLPDTLEYIGRLAFAYGEDYRNVTIPASVETLSYGAFFHCGDLEEVTLKSGVEEIGDYCFAQCKDLVKVVIPESVSLIGEDVFTVGYSSRVNEDDEVQLNKPLRLPRKLELYGRPNSAASEYAKANNIPFVIQKILATSVSIAEGKSVTLYMGEKLQLTAIQEPSNAETKVKWSSNSSSVKVSKTGMLTPKHSGKATITVRTENGKKARITVKVIDAKSVSIVQGKSVKMKVGEKLQLNAIVSPVKVTTKLTWSSSKKKIASVSSSGLVTAKRRGTATITVRTANKKKARIKIKVTK